MRKARGGPEADIAAQAAAAAASEAARTLQARQQEVIAEKKAVTSESTTEPQTEMFRPVDEKRVRRGNPDREAILAEMRQTRGEPKEEKKEEAKAEEKPAEAPEKPIEVKEEKKALEVAAEVVEAPKATETAPEVKKVKVKVDGVEDEVDEAIVNEYGGVKGYQIAKAAENRLAKAKEITEENRKTQGQLAQLAELLLKQNQPKEEPKVSDKEFLASKLDVIRFGTPEEASTAFQEVLTRQKPKDVDPQAIIQQAAIVIENKRAVEEFKREFADIVSNPTLNLLAITLERKHIAELPPNQSVDWGNFYRKIGNEIRTAVPRQSQPSAEVQQGSTKTTGTPSQPSGSSEKEAKKATIVNLPTASTRAELPKEEKELTREERLNQMRKRRGQPTY